MKQHNIIIVLKNTHNKVNTDSMIPVIYNVISTLYSYSSQHIRNEDDITIGSKTIWTHILQPKFTPT